MEITAFDVLLLSLVLGGGIWGVVTGATRLIAPFTVLLAVISLVHAYPDVSVRFGRTLWPQFFLIILLTLLGLLLVGLVGRALYTAMHTVGLNHVDRLIGAALGLMTGCVGAGLVVWLLGAYGGAQANALLKGSVLAPPVLEFFETIMALTEHLLPRPKPKEPWWKW